MKLQHIDQTLSEQETNLTTYFNNGFDNVPVLSENSSWSDTSEDRYIIRENHKDSLLKTITSHPRSYTSSVTKRNTGKGNLFTKRFNLSPKFQPKYPSRPFICGAA